MVNPDDDCTAVGVSCPADLDFTWLPGKDGKTRLTAGRRDTFRQVLRPTQ
jgi:hypothetical protein